MLDERINQNLYDCLLAVDHMQDTDVMLEYWGLRLTYAAFRRAVEQSMAALRDLGLAAGDRVVMSVISTPESIELLYACSAMGIVPVMADVRLSEKDYEALMKRMNARVLFINDILSSYSLRFAKAHPEWQVFILSPCDCAPAPAFWMHSARCLVLKNTGPIAEIRCSNVTSWRTVLRRMRPDGALPRSATGGREEIIFTTSGTTGAWKYVVLQSRQLNLAALENWSISQTDAITTVLSVMPLFTCYGFVVSIHLPLLAAKKLYLHPIYQAAAIPRTILKFKPSFYAGVYDHFEEFFRERRAAKADLSFLKLMYYGGERSDPVKLGRINDFLASHGCPSRLYQGYGMTEVASCAVLQRDDEEYRIGSAGRAMPYTEIKVVREGTFEPLPAGESGEICLHTPCQMIGYFDDPAATAAVLRPHDDGKVWVHTGDLGYLDADGYLYVTGRIKNMFVSSSGTKLFPSRIEDCAARVSGVHECAAVVLRPDESTHVSRIVLFVMPRKRCLFSSLRKKVATACKRGLPSYLWPDHVVVCRTLPRTRSGKTDYSELDKRAAKLHAQWGRRLQ